MIVALESATMPKEVNGEETGCLEDMNDAVRVLECFGNASQGPLEEMRLEFGERRRP